MHPLRYRQVHLDFHTSPAIDGVGADFDRDNFREALTAGHVDSITLFSKCHHGYAYHPSQANIQHPGLHGFNLLGAQLEVCRELGVNAPVYISAGLDEKLAYEHPEWLNKPSPNHGVDFVHDAHYHLFCYNTPYLDMLAEQVEEVMRMFKPTGIFLDISDVRTCYCSRCVKSMKKLGLNPDSPADVRRHGELVYAEYCRRMEEAVRKYDPDTNIFHNAGNIARGRRDLAYKNTHLELESLPTGGWGYDHFPMSAAYVRTLGMDYLGMTGKFHTTWGEFGGFKHPNALRYEAALSIAFGAKCSIGDQMHPRGKLNLSTYKLIGAAYSYVESVEKYCADAKPVADIAILSGMDGFNPTSDTGASRILLEGKYLYDIVDAEAALDGYKLLILPDSVKPDAALTAKLERFLAGGGKLLASGESCVGGDGAFIFDFGADFAGKNEFSPTYMRPTCEEGFVNGITEYIMYGSAYNINTTTAKVTAELAEPYFNRTPDHFCSHQHAPNKPGTPRPGMAVTDTMAYIAWQVFADYATKGELHAKELVLSAVKSLLPDAERSVTATLPDRGIVTLYRQDERRVLHALFAYTTVRGQHIEIIEDTLPLYNIDFGVKTPKAPKRIFLAPEGTELPFKYSDGVASFTLPKLEISQIIVIE
jgi:RNase P/RNase MRP subunit POP5